MMERPHVRVPRARTSRGGDPQEASNERTLKIGLRLHLSGPQLKEESVPGARRRQTQERNFERR